MATENRNVTEPHGCVVCGRVHNMLVVYSPSEQLVDCTVTSGLGRRVYDARKPMVVCSRHSESEVQAALARKAARDAEDEAREARGD